VIQAGRLRHRVTIERLDVTLAGGTENSSSSSSDAEAGDGARTETWSDAFGRYLSAEVVPLSGREFIAAAATQSKITTRITIRRRPGVDATMRVNHRGTLYNIEAVLPDPDSGINYLTLLCSSGVNDG
jgi:SPP1 family predicted phage head-tail adaptor